MGVEMVAPDSLPTWVWIAIGFASIAAVAIVFTWLRWGDWEHTVFVVVGLIFLGFCGIVAYGLGNVTAEREAHEETLEAVEEAYNVEFIEDKDAPKYDFLTPGSQSTALYRATFLHEGNAYEGALLADDDVVSLVIRKSNSSDEYVEVTSSLLGN